MDQAQLVYCSFGINCQCFYFFYEGASIFCFNRMTKGMSRTETTGPALADYLGWKANEHLSVTRAKDIEQSLGLPARASGSSASKRSTSLDSDSAKRHKDQRYQPEPRRGGDNPGRGHQGQKNFHRAPECARCGRRHTGECWGNGSSCWKCGARGHMRRDCPHPARDG
ncbi:hypothetical protein V6N13_114241 [Hibiscus sabdariffa]